jgi:hypothetical protein
MPSSVTQIVYINAAASNSQPTANVITSTKVRVVANAAVHYAIGVSPIAYRGNCDLIPADTVRYINMEGVGNKIAFNPTNNVTAEVSVVECGSYILNGIVFPGVNASSLPGNVTN